MLHNGIEGVNMILRAFSEQVLSPDLIRYFWQGGKTAFLKEKLNKKIKSYEF